MFAFLPTHTAVWRETIGHFEDLTVFSLFRPASGRCQPLKTDLFQKKKEGKICAISSLLFSIKSFFFFPLKFSLLFNHFLEFCAILVL